MRDLKLILSGIVAIILLSGCSQKVPDPDPVANWDKGAALSISHKLLLEKKVSVPKDPNLSKTNWTYQINATKKQNTYLRNDQIVRTFLVAHNAKEIIIIGREELINEYKKYFLDNDVTANIKLQPVTAIEKDFDSVNLLFLHKKD